MAKENISFSKLELKSISNITTVKINDSIDIEVRTYLPIDEKAKLIQYVIENAIDNNTGCFSPIRIEVYFTIAICKYYAGITFTNKQLENIGKTYDLLEENNIISKIINAINKADFTFLQEALNDTVKDVARYNSSAAGIIQSASNSAGNLDEQITDILSKIKNKEGLNFIKDTVENG